MNLPIKLWFLNITFLVVMILAVILMLLDKGDSVLIVTTMIGIPLTAYAAEMGLYSHAVANVFKHSKKEK